jgi:hypothetical protein
MERYKPTLSAKMVNASIKLITELSRDGISVSDNENNNRTFTKGNKTVSISHHSFYRYSGMTQITRTKKDSNGNDTNWTEVIPVTDDDWLQKFIKPIIYKLLEV